MLAVEEATSRITAAFAPLPAEWLPLGQALGRVLARDLVAPRDQPPQAVSAMDGYAVRAADLAAGTATLRLIGAAPAGGRFEGTLGAGETVRIFTGGPLPAGADAVALQEDAEITPDGIRLTGGIEPGTYVRPAGLDVRRGEISLPAGRRLTARDLGLAATLDQAWLPVRRRPRIALLATGDELVRPGSIRKLDQIANGNSVTLAAMITIWGGEPVDLGIVADRAEAFGALLPDLRGVDLIVTMGGASVGERDLVRQALGEHGLQIDFWRIAMRPGMPVLFGRVGGVPLLGLPGNPVSTGVCAVLFVRTVIATLLGTDSALPTVPAVLGCALGPNDRRQEYLRSTTRWRSDGRLEVHPATQQDSSMFALFARADCLVVRPPFAPAMPVGTEVVTLPLAPAPIGI